MPSQLYSLFVFFVANNPPVLRRVGDPPLPSQSTAFIRFRSV